MKHCCNKISFNIRLERRLNLTLPTDIEDIKFNTGIEQSGEQTNILNKNNSNHTSTMQREDGLIAGLKGIQQFDCLPTR
jgi:hypothetical protein